LHSWNLSRAWIMKNSYKMVWLPAEYRYECSAMFENMIAIGCVSRKVLIFHFHDDDMVK
jgi:hypothetical protein